MLSSECESRDDRELIALSLTDSQYFYCLMRRYEDRLSAYVHRLTYLSDDDIVDIIQNSFIKIYQHLNNFDPKLKFSSWAYRIVHNEAVNWLSRHRLSQKINLDTQDDDFLDWLTADTNFDTDILATDFQKHISSLLDQLKPEYKQVLLLKFFEDKDYREIGDILQKPMGTVATLISRAKLQFKQLYEQNPY